MIPRCRVHLDGRDAGRLGEGARRRSSPRRRPTRPRSSATTTGSRTRSSTRGGTRSLLLLLGTIPAFLVVAAVFWFCGRELQHGLRPRVRAGAADRHGAGARPDAAPPGRRGRLVRVHGDAVRPDPPRHLRVEARDDRAEVWAGLRTERVSDLELSAGKHESLRSWEREVADVVDAVIGRRAGAPLALPREDRGRPRGDEQALHRRSSRTSGRRSASASWLISLGVVPLSSRCSLFVADRRAALLPRASTAGGRSTRGGATSS